MSATAAMDARTLLGLLGRARRRLRRPREAAPRYAESRVGFGPRELGVDARNRGLNVSQFRALGRDSAGSQKSYEKPRNSHSPLFDSSMTQTQGATLGLTTKIGNDRVSVRVTGDLNAWFRR